MGRPERALSQYLKDDSAASPGAEVGEGGREEKTVRAKGVT